MKKAWISSLIHDENVVKDVIKQLHTYQINADGQFWIDDLPHMAWSTNKDLLSSSDIGLWIIIADQTSLANKQILQGLSALSIVVNSARSSLLPIIIFTPNGAINTESLPQLFQHAKNISDSSKIGVKSLAIMNTPLVLPDNEYRVNFHPLNELGLWIEIGPSHGTWDGVIAAVSNGEINFQAIGDKGVLPERCVLEYPAKGLKLELGSQSFLGCSIKNQITSDTSYFARITELPEQLIFMSNTDEEHADAFNLKLC